MYTRYALKNPFGNTCSVPTSIPSTFVSILGVPIHQNVGLNTCKSTSTVTLLRSLRVAGTPYVWMDLNIDHKVNNLNCKYMYM